MTILFLKFMNMVIWAIALATCSYVIANLTSYLIWSLRNKKELQNIKRLAEIFERERELEERERELEERERELIAQNGFDPFKK